MEELSELIADEAVTLGATYTQRKEYGNMLLKFAESENKNYKIDYYSYLSINAKKLAKRLERIMNKSSKRSNKTAFAFVSIAIVLTFGISVNTSAQLIQYSNDVEILQLPVYGFNYIEDIGEKLSADYCKSFSVDFFPTENMYAVEASESNENYTIQNLAYGNGQVIVIKDGEEGFEFEKNQEGKIRILADFSPKYTDGMGELLEVGYIYNGNFIELYSGRIYADELSVDFKADKYGNYQFYICNACAGLQNYTYISVEKN